MAMLALLWFRTHMTYEPVLEALMRANLFGWVVAKSGRRGRRASPVTLLGHLRDDVPEYSGLVNEWYRLAGEALFVAVALVIMLRIDVPVTLVTFLPLACVTLFTQWLRARLPRLWGEAREATTATTDFIGEVFGGLQAIRVAGAEDAVLRRFGDLGRARAAAEVRSETADVRVNSVSQAAIAGGQGLVLVVAAAGMLQGRFTVGDFVLFTVYLDWMMELPRRVGRLLSQAKMSQKSKERLQSALGDTPVGALVEHRPLYLTRPLPEVPPTAFLPPGERLRELVVSGLSVAHPDGNDPQNGSRTAPGRGVFDVNLVLKRGTVTVVTGEVGAGKSTLLEALLGLVERDSGSVLWNGVPVGDLPSFMVPPRVAYKPQVPRIFSEPLGETIRLGTPDDAAAMERALRRAAFADDVTAMPEGLATLVGPRGVRLSGGQAQRASAARMFIRPSELYVIDDLSSALDDATEREVWQQLDAARAQEETTYLIVSHRAQALLRADQIVVLADGRVQHTGTAAELRERSPLVRRILDERADD
jgi:ABC-type multidrug transport system fused ATPase/permease subunit